jgi:Asp-tRNA(Asn)/Glu-tRNA(Gln) amidotransferase A subunit family amidase
MDFRRTPLTEIAAQVRAKRVSAREVTEHSLLLIAEHNPNLNAFVAVDGERAMEQAAAVDQIVATGGDPGPLAGVPIGVKDGEDAAGYRTTHGSTLLADAAPAVHDSPHVARLRTAGCVVVGKTNLPEFAWAPNTTNPLFGTTRNPWNLEHSAGGSSGGTAAALAAGLVPLATGSDGGGSIRIPSACCGLSGMKPSLGRVPGGGAEGPGWLTFSTKGPMARRIADVVTALDVVVGPEPSDLNSLPRPEASWPAVLDDPQIPGRVAWSPTLGYAEVDAEVLAACERTLAVIESLGAEIVEVDTVFDTDPVDSWLTFVGSCLLRSLDPFHESPGWANVDPILAFVAEAARQTPAVDMVRVHDECHRMNMRLIELFHDVRLLVTPVTAGITPRLELGGMGTVNGEVTPNWVRFTYPFNMTRSPAATVCTGLSEGGLPVGIQLVGPQHADLVVLRSAAALEAAIGFDEVAPFGG